MKCLQEKTQRLDLKMNYLKCIFHFPCAIVLSLWYSIYLIQMQASKSKPLVLYYKWMIFLLFHVYYSIWKSLKALSSLWVDLNSFDCIVTERKYSHKNDSRKEFCLEIQFLEIWVPDKLSSVTTVAKYSWRVWNKSDFGAFNSCNCENIVHLQCDIVCSIAQACGGL